MMTSSAHPDENAPLTADDLERPTLERVRAFLDADRDVEADLVLQAWDRTTPDDPGAIPLRTRIAQARMDPVRLVAAADAHLQRASRAPKLRLAKARACYRLGRIEEGLATLASMKIPPGHPLAAERRWWQARLLIRCGRYDDARSKVLPSMTFDGEDAMRTTLRGEIELLEGDLATARTTLAGVLDLEDAPRRARRESAFLLARACDRMGDPDAAFDAAARGHALHQPVFDPDEWDRSADALIETQDASWFDRVPTADRTAASPVLVIGLPRSGTSLLEQVIASHPAAAGVGERQDPFRLVENLEVLASVRAGLPTRDDLGHATDAYLEMQRRCGASETRVVNKALCLERTVGWMSRIIPGLRIIRLERDPRDTLLSIHQHPLSPRIYPWAASLEHLVRIHATFQRLMDHWTRVLPDSILAVDYESLVDDQEATTNRVLDFLGLERDDTCLRFHETRRTVITPSHDQIRRPMNRDGIGRWHRYADRIEPILRAFPPPAPREAT